MGAGRPLTDKQKMFVLEYLVDLNATQAAIRAGYSEKNADKIGPELIGNTRVQEAIQEAMKARSERTEITQDKVLRHWWSIATADPNEIIHLRRVCCRHCFGIEYQYQWRDKEEYQRAVDEAISNAKEDEEPKIPSNAGGYGFDRLLRPHPKCPYCRGEGREEVHIEDTRDIGPKAKLLYAGIKQTTTGIEIKFRDQDKAMENVARHLGMFTDKMELTGKDGGPMEIATLTPEERQARINELIAKRGN
jgi:phage terminase small subunit